MYSKQASDLAQRFGLGPMDQVAFVVRNMNQALPAYEALFGRFHVIEVASEAIYRGTRISPQLKLALNKTGPLEIELCEVGDGGPPHGEYLQRHGEGLYHIRFRVQKLQQTLQAMEGAGFTPFYSGASKTVRFAYLEPPAQLGHLIIELIEFIAASAS